MGRSNASHSCRKRDALSAASLSIAPPRCAGLLASTPSGRPSTRTNAVTIPAPNSRRSSSTEPVSASSSMSDTHVVDLHPVLGDRVAEQALIRALPLVDRAVEVREVLLGDADGLRLVGDAHVDHPAGGRHVDRADLLRRDAPEATAFDHRGPRHAEVGVLGGDDDVAAPEQRRVPRERRPARDPDERDEPGQLTEQPERHALEAGADPVVAGTATAAVGEQHERQALRRREPEQPILLAVVVHALGAREDGVVVDHDHAARAVDRRDPTDETVGRRAGDELLTRRPTRLRRERQRAVFDERARVAEVVDVLRRGATAASVLRGDRGGARRVLPDVVTGNDLGEVGPDRRRDRRRRPRRRRRPSGPRPARPRAARRPRRRCRRSRP